MTTATSESRIIPFGKYKGQPVDVLSQDREYCQWLMEQPWFRDKFQPIYTVIVNHFGDPAETPEHNQLQALFTDAEFAKRFVRHIHGPWLVKEFPRLRQEQLNWTREQLERAKLELGCYQTNRDLGIHWRQLIHQLQTQLVQVEQMTAPEIYVAVEFETNGIDVAVEYDVFPLGTAGDGDWVHVECKPALGDDYPAVLRQIAASYEFGQDGCTNVLLVGAGGYTGTGATLEQVKSIFDSRNVPIVFLKDISTYCTDH